MDLLQALGEAHPGPVSPDRPTQRPESMYSRLRRNVMSALEQQPQPAPQAQAPGHPLLDKLRSMPAQVRDYFKQEPVTSQSIVDYFSPNDIPASWDRALGGYPRAMAQGIARPIYGALQAYESIPGLQHLGADPRGFNKAIAQQEQQYQQGVPGGHLSHFAHDLAGTVTGVAALGSVLPEVGVGEGLGAMVRTGAAEGAMYGAFDPTQGNFSLQQKAAQIAADAAGGAVAGPVAESLLPGVAAETGRLAGENVLDPVVEKEEEKAGFAHGGIASFQDGGTVETNAQKIFGPRVGGYINSIAEGSIEPVLAVGQMLNKVNPFGHSPFMPVTSEDRMRGEEMNRQILNVPQQYRQSLPGGKEDWTHEIPRVATSGAIAAEMAPEMELGNIPPGAVHGAMAGLLSPKRGDIFKQSIKDALLGAGGGAAARALSGQIASNPTLQKIGERALKTGYHMATPPAAAALGAAPEAEAQGGLMRFQEGGAADPNDYTGQFNTAIPAEQQSAYQTWLNKLPEHQRSTYDYDMQGAFLQGAQQSGDTGHFTDQFKKPNHVTFSTESQYSGHNGEVGGRWAPNPDKSWSFYASPTNLKYHDAEDMKRYFNEVEKGNHLVLPQGYQAGGPSQVPPPNATQQDYQDWLSLNFKKLNQVYRSQSRPVSPKSFEEWLPAPQGTDPAQWKQARAEWEQQRTPTQKSASWSAPQSKDIIDLRSVPYSQVQQLSEDMPPTPAQQAQWDKWEAEYQKSPSTLRLPKGTYPRAQDYPAPAPQPPPPQAAPASQPPSDQPPQIGPSTPGWMPGSWSGQEWAGGGLYGRLRRASLANLR
jgi:hypothetical protein